MKQILYSIFSCIILLYPLQNYAQEDSSRIRSVRVGADLSKFAVPFFIPEVRGLEFLADIQISDEIFAAGEYGINTAKLTTDSYSFNYNLSGTFLRLGFDKNILKDSKGAENDIVFIGGRYSFAAFKHKADEIYIRDDHWDDVTSVETNEYSLQAHWLEIAVGIKTELFKNLFLGWTMRGMVKIKMKKDNIMTPYIIPGYGYCRGDKKSAFGFNYSLFYRFPYKLPVKERRSKDET
jgi:hypothetical protein